MKKEIEFMSDGYMCRGELITPDGAKGPFPTVIMAGGWCYVKEIVMPDYAEAFVKAGFAALLFDYRCLGNSDGPMRQHINPWWQIEDYRNAISFAEIQPEVDENRIAVWGISYSGGHVLIVGALDSRVKGIVSTIPVVDGWANMNRSHGEKRFAAYLDLMLEDRRKRFANPGERGSMPFSCADTEAEVSVWPYPEIETVFMEHKRQRAPLHEHWNTIESGELLLSYTVFPYVHRIVNTPVIMTVAEGDNITVWDLEIEAFRLIKSRQKSLFVIPKTTHMTLYKDIDKLEIVANAQKSFLSEHLIKPFS